MVFNPAMRPISSGVGATPNQTATIRAWRVLAAIQRFCFTIICAAAMLTPRAGHAAVTARDIEVAGHILALTSNPLSGKVRVGIVYDPDNPISTQDERSMLAILGSGLAIGDVNLIPVPLAIGNITAIPTDIIFLTTGLGPSAVKARDQAARERILCMTTDLAATQAGFCAVGLQIDTKVHINIDLAALAASNVSFTEAFMLMVNEI